MRSNEPGRWKRLLRFAGAMAAVCAGAPNAGAATVGPGGSDVVAQGLSAPAALAFDPAGNALIVAENGARRILALREGRFETVAEMPDEGVTGDAAALLMSLDGSGGLLVGRRGATAALTRIVLWTTPSTAPEALALPPGDVPLCLDGLAADSLGRISVTLHARNDAGGPGGSYAALRDATGGWYLVGATRELQPHEPAADWSGRFHAVAAPDEAVVRWFDPAARRELTAMEAVRGLRHIAICPDGWTVAAVVCGNGATALLELDPATGARFVRAEGLPVIGGLAVDPRSGQLFASLPDSGTIVRWPPRERGPAGLPALRESEPSAAAAPPVPGFLRQFIDQLPLAAGGERDPGTPIDEISDELLATVPLVAGKFDAIQQEGSAPDHDPIEAVSFLLVHPIENTRGARGAPSASVSLLRVARRSGAVATSRVMSPRGGTLIGSDASRVGVPGPIITLPQGYRAPEQHGADTRLCRIYFLGMGLGPDYWFDLDRSDPSRSTLRVERQDGTQSLYRLAVAQDAPLYLSCPTPLKTLFPRLGPEPVSWRALSASAGPTRSSAGASGDLSASSPWLPHLVAVAAVQWGRAGF
jgi:hypothetical protein